MCCTVSMWPRRQLPRRQPVAVRQRRVQHQRLHCAPAPSTYPPSAPAIKFTCLCAPFNRTLPLRCCVRILCMFASSRTQLSC